MASVNAPMSNASAKLRSRKMTNPSPLDEAVELKPCPFCGAEMEPSKQIFAHPDSECVLRNHGFYNEKADAWNTRAILNALSPDEERRDD
jgi:hypothetical protein